MEQFNTNYLKQYILLAVILGLVVLLGWQLFTFFPGILGAVTMYILMRQYYFKLTVVRGWKKWLTATLFIIVSLVVFVLPFAAIFEILLPKINYLVNNIDKFSAQIQTLSGRLEHYIPGLSMDEEQIKNLVQKLGSSVPILLSATMDVLSNLILAFFLLYFMLTQGRVMENKILKYLPLQDKNIDNIWQATRLMVVSNAIGIPVLAACQAAVAAFGYWIFGVEQYVLWGIVTGIFSMVPVVGTAIVWVPLVIYLFSIGHTGAGLGLMLFSFTIIINIDNVLRFTLLKKLGDVHPITTVLGILVGIPLFGFMGLIFGPLLISYLLLLISIYRIEFPGKKA